SENIFIDNIKFESTDAPVNAAGTLVINEIDYDQPGTDNAEFIEIKNVSNEAIALGAYSLELYNGSNGGLYNTIVLDNAILSAGDYYVVCADASTVDHCDQDVTPDTNLIQNGAPDAIRLVNTTLAETVDQVSYEGSVVDVVDVVEGTGTESFDSNSIPDVGLSRTPDGADSNDNNADFAFRCSTPGALNSDQSSNCVAPSEVLISAIQGSGIESPLVGETVTVEAIVVGDFQSGGLGSQGDLRGFYLQEESSDWDTDAKTSEGIYVFDGTSPGVDVAVGDKVVVTGTVAEYFGETQINVTSGSVVKQSSGNTVTPTSLLLPATETITNSDGDLIANLEAYEGMLISFPQSLSVTELYQLDRFGELRLAQGGRFFQFTQNSLPSVSGFQTHLEDIARRNVILDDGLSNQNPDPIRYPAPGLTTDNALRMGDTVTGLTGVVRYSRGSGGSGDEGYRIMPTAEPVFVAENARSEAPEVGGTLKVASFNVLNFFNTLDTSAGACYPSFSRGDCRGADNQAEFDRQLEKTVTALSTIGADVYGLLEIENDYTDGSSSAIATLTSALNATETSCSEFGYVDPGARIGSDAIAVGMIYCKDTVELASGSTPSILDDSDLEALGMESRAPLFNGYATNRATLATTFTEKASGESLTIAINHFKSKGDSGLADSETCQNAPGSDLNCDQNDGQGFWNQRRTFAAEALSAWLQTFPTGHTDPDFLVMGDLNGYAMEGPVTALIDRGYTNLVTEFHSAGDAYSYVFDGQAGNLDHGLANASLLTQVNDAQDWHINSDEADGLDYNTDFGRNTSLFDGTVPFRSSDHDPLIIGLNLQSIARGDYDQDGDIDRNDMLLLRQHLNENVEPGHPMDWNDDGRITGLDIRLLILQCSNQHCASSN
ncbi:MAG: ExeM/NucH family extracellular endonuclease, partial [Pseudomonadales bacterium]|nr:ExeM/NucH family extracellular endonuclease [Pseudomonadales bacterium]